jgi:7-cyano-7-deazaguanine synthase in queuosine biosynthesis
MPTNERLVLCGGLSGPRKPGSVNLSLDRHGRPGNVHLKIPDISKRLVANIPDALVDLLEIACYIYAADSAILRGGPADAQMGMRWRRKLRFVIPVRRLDLWSSAPVASALVETLSFLSEDEYEIEFRSLSEIPVVDTYFEFPTEEATSFRPDEVILFSGGLDSLAGTVERMAKHGKKVALVSHRSSPKITSVQRYLADQLRSRFGADRVLHVPVWVTLDGSLGRELTHRTRSFLFAALGAVTARLFGRDQISIFENGVVSLNLPSVAQVVGARATRTTHPQVLAGFRRLLGNVLCSPFDVDNPFIWLTKAEIVQRIADNGCSDLIRYTRSCTRVHEMTIMHPHCGRCSQCVDRRFAIIAANQDSEDPPEAYGVDLFQGKRPRGPDQEMALAYVRSASNVNQITDIAFFAHYGETSRVVGFFPESADTVASRIFDLHQRHAATVCRVFDAAITSHAPALREGRLSSDCLLSLVVSQREGGSTYPSPSDVPALPATPGPEIRIAIDTSQKRVVFDRWGELKGVSASLITALAEPFRQAARDELAPEHYPFTETSKLLSQNRCNDGETLRRRIKRCRDTIADLAKKADGAPPSPDAIIENLQWHGYRLNPDRIRIVALAELSGGGTGHASPPKGHASPSQRP